MRLGTQQHTQLAPDVAYIETEKVKRVLLVDGWHDVALTEPGCRSFCIESFAFATTDEETGGLDEAVLNPGDHGLCPVSFAFEIKENGQGSGRWIHGPLTSILAVETEL